jgi:hypothetical protein
LRLLGGEALIIADKELTKEDLLTVADDCLCTLLYLFLQGCE